MRNHFKWFANSVHFMAADRNWNWHRTTTRLIKCCDHGPVRHRLLFITSTAEKLLGAKKLPNGTKEEKFNQVVRSTRPQLLLLQLPWQRHLVKQLGLPLTIDKWPRTNFLSPTFFYERTYLDTHAEWKWQRSYDEEDGDEGQEQGAASRSFRVSCNKER